MLNNSSSVCYPNLPTRLSDADWYSPDDLLFTDLSIHRELVPQLKVDLKFPFKSSIIEELLTGKKNFIFQFLFSMFEHSNKVSK